jgi:hypothetical protein
MWPLKRRNSDRPRTRRPARGGNHNVASGPDPLLPRVSYEDRQGISLQRTIDIELWSKGEPYPPALARKFELNGPNRKIADNPATKMIIAQKADLRRQIANTPKLVKDFEFFLDKMGWYPEKLLQHLYWDSNMMQANSQTILAKEKKKTWPIDRESLGEIRGHLRVLAEQVERLNKTDFSPARTAILRNEEGNRLHPADERYLLRIFRNLPEVLRFYGGELNRKLSLTDFYWSREMKRWKFLVEEARRTSLYEQIRAKADQYHVVRLHRLVNASRRVQGLSPINQRAFIIWLNRLKKRHEEMSRSPTSSPRPEGSLPSPQA